MLKMLKGFVADYLLRHKSGADRWLHIIGVPLAFFGLFLLFTERWKTGLWDIFIGYTLQWIGHAYFDKNEMGEWILIKKVLARWKII